MPALPGSARTRRGRAGRHRRTGDALVERRDHTEERPPRRFSLPAPSPSALVGIAVLVLIAIGVVHLSGTGAAVPLESPTTAADPSTTGGSPDAAETPAGTGPAADAGSPAGADAPAGAAPETAAPRSAAPSAAGDGATEVVVHVSGAVAHPGVVRLPHGARVDDALTAAGGPLEGADLAAVNLARPLVDGEQVHVPMPGEEPRPVPPAPAGTGAAGPEAAASGERPEAGGRIDLNTAEAAELEELPGVGPSIAQRIVEHREKNGPFASVDALLEVSGIGPATLEKIRERATV